jgi:YidC/Oxa1 family membrane protein insertase
MDTKNLLFAIALSMAVLLGWQYFYGVPKMEQQRREAQIQAQLKQQSEQQQGASAQPGQPTSGALAPPVGAAVPTVLDRQQAIEAGKRVIIDTPKIRGSIPLKGAEIDDISLKDYRETVDPNSPNIVVFSPFGTPQAYYAQFGWLNANNANNANNAKLTLPGTDTVWSADALTLTPAQPVTLSWDNGQGLLFKRRFAIDENYMVTVTDSVMDKGAGEVSLVPYALVRRHGLPVTQGFFILHEGLIGVAGEQGLQEFTYSALDKADLLPGSKGRGKTFANVTGGFAGITDKYWAAALVPDQTVPYESTFSAAQGGPRSFQADVLLPERKLAAGGAAEVTTRLFVGAKEVNTIDAYERDLGIKRFDLLIDWGWFYFITKPLFKVLDAIYRFVGNFGVAILIVTVLVKLVFFPLANKSYISMAKMKAVQPEMMTIRERFADDKMKQQQELMELYRREKINPLAGCLPVLIQIPVFFALYKVLFVTIEMRHAPFFGWIRDLAAPDPTSIFNAFGLLPFAVPAFLLIGVWPIIMGITMFVQMKMNPEPTDPIQKTMFTWMPVFFTFLLASFPAGLVIYWSWNNFLSVLQQYAIMRRQGVKVELWDNITGLFRKKPASTPS